MATNQVKTLIGKYGVKRISGDQKSADRANAGGGHADRVEAKKAKVSASGHEGKREGRWEVTYPSVFH